MKATYIDYSDTLSFSPLLIKYLQNDESLKSFYGNRPDIAGFTNQINEKPPVERETLVNSLLAQHENSNISEKSLNNINLLRESTSYTITTGHQLNIFTGPLYFIFKIATTIKLASDLKSKFPDK